ncbi:MAG: hypothetical protein ACYCOU_14460 [Sulfobacillus sp.]
MMQKDTWWALWSALMGMSFLFEAAACDAEHKVTMGVLLTIGGTIALIAAGSLWAFKVDPEG